jgi:hypothetical protein
MQDIQDVQAVQTVQDGFKTLLNLFVTTALQEVNADSAD